MWKVLREILKFTHDNVNTYLILDQNRGCLIDAAVPVDVVINELDKLEGKLELRYILLTHGHLNHVRYLPEIKSRLGGEVYIHPSDLPLLIELSNNLQTNPLKNLDRLNLPSLQLVVFHTPGHTEGSTCFYVKELNALFTGDTLLRGGFGEIKGPHSMGRMLRSLKMISRTLPPETIVYPGHGSETKLKNEAWLDGLDMLS